MAIRSPTDNCVTHLHEQGLLDRYVGSVTFTKAKVRDTQTGQIERHLKQLLGKRHVASLKPEDIRGAFAAIRDGKTAGTFKTGPRGLARVTGGEGAARYACRLLRAAFNWAVPEELIDRNPTTGISFGQNGERNVSLDARQYKKLFETLRKDQDQRRLHSGKEVADAIRVIALTGARRGEIANLQHRYVDLRSGRIELPRRAHKTGKKTGKPRVITLPSAAQEIIARQPQRRAGRLRLQGEGWRSGPAGKTVGQGAVGSSRLAGRTLACTASVTRFTRRLPWTAHRLPNS